MEFAHGLIIALAPFTVAIFAFWPVYMSIAIFNAFFGRHSFSHLPSRLLGLWLTLLFVRAIATQAHDPNPFAALMPTMLMAEPASTATFVIVGALLWLWVFILRR